jgi:hypothetical protein
MASDAGGPVTIAVDGWIIDVQHGLPLTYGYRRQRAVLCEEVELSLAEGDSCFLAVTKGDEPRSRLVLAQRYQPSGSGFEPGVAFVPETGVLFAGAGTRLLAYVLSGQPERLWEDYARCGFWHWSVHGSAVLMAAELEFAAWTSAGEKLWTTFVEPPWTYQVDGDQVQLDVMGRISEFPVSSGPAGGREVPSP